MVELFPKHKQLVHPKLKAVLPGEERYNTDRGE